VRKIEKRSNFAGLERLQSPRPRSKGQEGSTGGIEEEGWGREGGIEWVSGTPLMECVKFGTHRLPRPRARCRFPSFSFARVKLIDCDSEICSRDGVGLGTRTTACFL
jgi:hypothetical protein